MSHDGQGYRLSPQQRRLWALAQDGGDGAARTRYAALVEGELDEARLRHAVEGLVARYEILRTTFRCLPGLKVPVQVVRDAPDPLGEVFAVEDARSGPDDEALVARFLDPGEIEPAGGSGLRVRLGPAGGAGRLLLVSAPVLCADGPSLALLVSALAAAYAEGPRAGDDEALLQFADVAEWQNQLVESDEGREGAAHFRRDPWPKILPRLHCEIAAPAGGPFRPARYRRVGGGALSRAIEEAARRGGLSPASWLAGCWQILLQRLSDDGWARIGREDDGRSYAELAGAIGPLARPFPWGATLSPDEGIGAALARLDALWQADAPWRDYFVPDDLFSSAAGTGSFPWCFDFVDGAAPIAAGPLRFMPLGQTRCTDRYRLKLSCFRSSRGLQLHFDFDPRACDPEGVARLAAQLEVLVEDALTRPEAPIESLELVGPEERRRVLVDFQGPSRPPEPTLLHERFEAQAARHPERIALVAGDERLTYRELDERAGRVSRILRGLDVGPEDFVGLHLERGVAMVVAVLGVLKAGAAYLPLDPEVPPARLAYVLGDSGAKVVLTTRALAPALREAGGEPGPAVIDVDAAASGERPEALDGGGPARRALPDHPAYVLYTSGSTGWPKGVVVGHRQAVNHMRWMQEQYPLADDDVVLQKTAFGFDASVWELHAPLGAGARLVMARPGGHQDPAYLVEQVIREGVTILQVVPSVLRLLLDQPELAACRTLRRVYSGGETLALDLARRFHALRGAACELVNLYGPTETTIEVLSHRFGSEAAAGPEQVPIGRPIHGARLYVLDERLRPRPIGVRGELYVAGVPLARGYHCRPELTAERFVPDPFAAAAGERMYRTGDQAAWRADGTLDFFGRLDDQVKIRGFRVELGEVEAAAARHPAVRAAVALALPDGSGSARLVAYYVTAPGAAVDEAALRAFLLESLPPYMVPSLLVALPELPLMPNGKIDRRALAALSPERSLARLAAVPPRDIVELRLVRIWEQVLNVHPIGVTDNFFELGGHSLLAVSLVSAVQREFGEDLPLALLLRAPTVEAQARELTTREIAPRLRSPLVAVQTGGGGRPLFFVHPTGGAVLCYLELARHLGPDQPFYALQDPSLYSDRVPYRSLEEMAALYVSAMREVQRHGPYLLGGWSSGGVIAYEMAQQLRREREEVGLLAVIDSQAPLEPEPPAADGRLFTSVARLLAYLAGGEHRLPEGLRDADAPDLDTLLELAQSAKLLPPGVGRDRVLRLFEVFRSHVDVVSRYRPDTYPRRVTVLRATESLPEWLSRAALHRTSKDPALGWGHLAAVRVCDVPGHHLNMITAANAGHLAERLKEAINGANRIYDLSNRVLFSMLGH